MGGEHRNRVIWVLNAACPSRCVYCDIESQRKTKTLSADDVARVCGEIVGAGFREVVFVGGEPFLSPELPVALRGLAGRCTIAVFTGGLPGKSAEIVDLVKLGVNRIVLSIDSGRDAANDLIRGRKGITRELVAFVEQLRAELPRIDLSLNTVVSKHNVGRLADVWERMRAFRPDSWALTLVGDNFTGSPREHLPDRAQLEALYLREIPDLAGQLDRERAELVVLPVPLPFLVKRAAPRTWATAVVSDRSAVMAELELYASGEYNRSFVGRFGCPLVGVDVSIGVGGEVYPCSQAPALQAPYVVGDLRSASLGAILAGEALSSFGARVPHPPCSRCWAPSNVERPRLVKLVADGAR